MRRIKASIMALLIAATLLINVYKPESHEKLSESPTVPHEIVAMEYNGFDAVHTQYLDAKRQQDEANRRLERKQALDEAHRLYDEKIAEEQRRVAQKREEQWQLSRSNDVNLTQFTMDATHYTARCDGCTGITASGIDVTNTIYANGLRIIAVDPSVIALGSIVRVEYGDGTTFKAIAGDVGGGIKNKRIDVLVASKNEAYRLGRQQVTVTILKNGKGR